MKIFGKTPGEYVRFAAGPLALTIVVGVLRYGLYQAGASVNMVKWLSVTTVSVIAILYYSVRVPVSRFGSYKQLLPLCLLQFAAASWIAGLAVVSGILTGADNIYTRPEYSSGGDGKNWGHAFGHFVVVPLAAGLVTWLVGCAILLVTKRLTEPRPAALPPAAEPPVAPAPPVEPSAPAAAVE
jgi:hypothetical protein